MFSIFRKKPAGPKTDDKVLMSEQARLATLFKVWQNTPDTVFIFWFDESLERAAAYFNQHQAIAPVLLTAREAAHRHGSGPVVFGEHYPVRAKEEELWQNLNLENVTIYSSLEEPLFQRFGGERIITLMKQLGMEENETISHTMISQSIRNAQEKIAKQVSFEQTAGSQEDWFKKNLPA